MNRMETDYRRSLQTSKPIRPDPLDPRISFSVESCPTVAWAAGFATLVSMLFPRDTVSSSNHPKV